MPEGEETFECRPLFPMHLIAVLASQHRLLGATVELSELANEPLLLLGREFASRTWFDATVKWHASNRACWPKAQYRVRAALARDGHGVAMVPSPDRSA
jgi:DNA-binding transcriptional LysR family regulator